MKALILPKYVVTHYLSINDDMTDLYQRLLQEDLSEDPQTDDAAMAQVLAPIDFSDWRSAQQTLQRIAQGTTHQALLVEILPSLLVALSDVAEPDRVLVRLEQFAQNVPDRAALFRFLLHNPQAVELLVTILAGSQFLTQILLRNPEYFERLINRHHLAEQKTAAQFTTTAKEAIAPLLVGQDDDSTPFDTATETGILNGLRRWQRWHLLRLGTCDLLGLMDIPTITRQLSSLADSLISLCLWLAGRQTSVDPAGFVILGMGKLGGMELNYSSDIDLLFVSAESGIAYRSFGQQIIENLRKVTEEGFLYRVDMRLRPWGQTGPLVTSLDSYVGYLEQHARLWEKQALLKARIIASDRELGDQFLRQIEPFLFQATAEAIREDLSLGKARIEAHLRKRGRKWGEVKSGEGSIRDIEFVTQYLQLAHGRKNRAICSANTLEALTRLANHEILSSTDYRVLSEGYSFLRAAEHYLQMTNYQQTHTLPSKPEELQHLALRLGFRGANAGGQFVSRYQRHTEAIREVYRHYLEKESPASDQPQDTLPQPIAATQMPRSYSETFKQDEIDRHNELLARLNTDNPLEVTVSALDDGYFQITIVGYDYLGMLSLICGLMYVHRLNIVAGHVFTSRVRDDDSETPSQIVDVFTVRPMPRTGLSTGQPIQIDEAFWADFTAGLKQVIAQLASGERERAQIEVLKRVTDAMAEETIDPSILPPIDIFIDIEEHERYTILQIDTPDTIGFLYEFANALTLNNISIAGMTIQTQGRRVQDTLYVTDNKGRKITSGRKLFEMRAATVLVKHFTHLLPNAPNPAAALQHFHQFLGQLFNRSDWPTEVATLIRPEVLDALARLLGVSDFLWDDFLRMQYENLFPVLRDIDMLQTVKSKNELQVELDWALLAATDGDERRQVINDFKDREMFRIDMRHILGHTRERGQFANELSDLAEVTLTAVYQLCDAELQEQYGAPQSDTDAACRLTICALGKFGGRELGFASDIELMFIFTGVGKTAGPQVIPSEAFYERLVQAITSAIRTKQEGIFEIDLRLRPYGKAGRLSVPLPSFQRYFAADGPAWDYERQALVKLRPIAGDPDFGEQISALRDELIYDGRVFDVATMRGMRERQIRHLVTGGTVNAKFSPGGLVDIEYLVQGLQITYGHQDPNLRVTSTRDGIRALQAAGMISEDDGDSLYQAYGFIRRLINALRMVRGHAKDLTVPAVDSEEFAFLARRLDYKSDMTHLQDDLTTVTAEVQEINIRLLSQLGAE